MKKLLVLLTFLSVGVFTSCGKEEDAGQTTTITVASDYATRYTGESFTFNVKDNEGTDISSVATILVNDEAITGKVFTTEETGTYKVKAKYNGIESKAIEVVVTENPVPLTSITTTPSATNVLAGDVVTFTVMGNNNTNVTAKAIIFVNGTAISGTSYTATETGTLECYATFVTKDNTTLQSENTQVIVAEAVNFNKRVLIEDYTGTWCGYCPRISYAIELAKEQSNDIEVVAVHSGGNDPFKFPQASALEKAFGVSGYPTGKLNRMTTWKYSEVNNVKQVVDLTKGTNPRVGLALKTSLNGTTANVEVNVKFGQSFSGLKLVVYAVEDKLIADQTNYTTYYGGAKVIKGFEYNEVLRSCLTSSVLGDDITGSTNVNDEFSKTFTYEIPSTVKAENVRFVAFVVDSSKKALNSRSAHNNENQEFEIE